MESSPCSNGRALQGSGASSAQLPSGLPVGGGLSSVHPRGRGLLGGQGQSLVWVARCLPGGPWSGGQLVRSVSRACRPAHLLPAVLSSVGRGPEPFKYQKLCAQTQMRWGHGQWSPHVKWVPDHCAWLQSVSVQSCGSGRSMSVQPAQACGPSPLPCPQGGVGRLRAHACEVCLAERKSIS